MNIKRSKLINVLDIETTGLDCTRDSITEICILKMDREYKIIKEFHYFLKPSHSISSQITELTGLTTDMLSGCSGFKDVQGEFLDFINEDDIYSFGNLDENFLKKLCYINNKFINVLFLVRKRYCHLKKYTFSNVCNALKVLNLKQHSAESDALALSEVIKKMRL